MQIHIARPDKNYGPYSLDEVNEHLASGLLVAADLAWFEGSTDWIPLSQMDGVQIPPAKAPPPPPPAFHPLPQGPGAGQPAPFQTAQNFQSALPGSEQTIFEITPTISPDLVFTFLTCGLWLPFLVAHAITNQGSKIRLTTERLIVTTGLVSCRVEEIELYRIKDVTFEQGFFGRICGYGTVIVHANDATSKRLWLRNVNNPISIKEQIRDGSRASRRAEGVRSVEYGSAN